MLIFFLHQISISYSKEDISLLHCEGFSINKQTPTANVRSLATALSDASVRLEVDKLLWLAAPSPAAAQLLQAITAARPKLRVHKLPLPLQVEQLQARYDICLVLAGLTSLISGALLQDLARLKNQFCNRIELVILDDVRADKDRHATETALFALGFRRSGQIEIAGQIAQCYCYELKSYNKKRSWNSPENWANPQNFDKYRW